MILVKVGFEYNVGDKIRALAPEQLAELCLDCPDLDIPPPEDMTLYWSPSDIYLDLAQAEVLIEKWGFKTYLYKVKGLQYLQEISSKAAANTTSITNVSVANHNLFCVDEVTWLTDACTNDLQNHLNAGWRILAVCPPNDTRRPDYILGRQRKLDVGQ